MKIETLVVGELESNCHIVINEDLKSAVLIDCGGEPEKILNYLNKNSLELKAILLTHGHYDHFQGVYEVQNKTNCNVYISYKDSIMLTSNIYSLATMLNYPNFEPVENFITVSEGNIIRECDFEFKVLSTPGHTDGGLCYICQDNLFTGDTLFKQSMGRTDYPTGSYIDMRKSLKRLYELDGNYNVYAGHNENSDLQSERDLNPYMKDALNDDFYLY